jgi:1,4-alpha-glucan branching enzyme
MKQKIEVKKQAFSKIFRWQLPASQTASPAKVEVAGTFSNWEKLPMDREVSGGWHLTLHQIPGNRTHHYMFFADGQPVHDRYSDGLAIPQNTQEEQFAITTARGPRVFMLFSQTK